VTVGDQSYSAVNDDGEIPEKLEVFFDKRVSSAQKQATDFNSRRAGALTAICKKVCVPVDRGLKTSCVSKAMLICTSYG
jgi:hypothetical protein